MSTRYIQEFASSTATGAFLQRNGPGKGAAGIGIDAGDGFKLKYNQNGSVARVYDDNGIATARIPKVATLALTGAAVHAAAVGIVNPEGVDVIVTGINFVLSTHATAASGAVDVGFTATSISTASDNIADGLAVGSGVTAPIAYVAGNQAGANGKLTAYWTAAKWITVSDDGTADVTGMVATLYINYILV